MTVTEAIPQPEIITNEKVARSYILPQDPSGERTRLQAFHKFFNHIFNGEMINQTALNDIAKIAKLEDRLVVIVDVGTKTAAWPLHIANTLQIPPVTPSNIDLRVWNVNDPPKEEWKGKYDYVHISLFVAVIAISQIPALIEHARELLRPGGYLDWVDGNSGYCRVSPGNPWTEIGRKAFIAHLKVMGKDPHITDHLSEYYKAAGFENIEQKDYTTDDMENLPEDIKKTLTSCLALATHGVLRNALGSDNKILRNSMPVKTIMEAEELIAATEEEVRRGCTFTIPISRIIGQKAI